jgi:hypothetical protein
MLVYSVSAPAEVPASAIDLKARPRPPLRHCPLCGIAMQARKSRDDIPRFDVFECLSCNTTIRQSKPEADDPSGR